MEKGTVTPPFGAMRRKEREITSPLEIEEIINTGKVMHLALCDNNMPFLVPVFYTYLNKYIYFHSAKAGTKIDIMKKNNNVCFEISLDNGIVESDSACDFEAKHRTVIGFGKAEFVEDEKEKIAALDGIVAQFTDKKFEYPKGNVNAAAVIRIGIVSVKGKKHGL